MNPDPQTWQKPEIEPHDAIDFVRNFAAMQGTVYAVNVRNGWWQDRVAYIQSGLTNAHPNTVCALTGLIHTELSEAIEAARKHHRGDWSDHKTKDTMVREFAGAVVRIMDLCAGFNLPLGAAIVEEVNANAQRGYRHGGKAA